jgi:hypothetical protein
MDAARAAAEAAAAEAQAAAQVRILSVLSLYLCAYVLVSGCKLLQMLQELQRLRRETE